jgi:heme-degrading monooxygenase HmoA
VIARTWIGVTPADKSEEYWQYLRRTGLADYRATPGFRGITVLRRVAEGKAVFELTTVWDSFDAIRAFAGDDVEKARYYPEDEAFLLEMAPTVEHREVLAWPGEGDAGDETP